MFVKAPILGRDNGMLQLRRNAGERRPSLALLVGLMRKPGFHTALRLSARGWETAALPAPNGSGAIVVGLDLQSHEATVEHSQADTTRVALTPDRSVREVTQEVMEAVRGVAGEFDVDLRPAEVPWTVALDDLQTVRPVVVTDELGNDSIDICSMTYLCLS